MAKIEFPKPLKSLLEDSDLSAPIRSLADRAGEILADNKLPFFPDYTDHGIDHIREARRFNDRNLAKVIGLESVRRGWKFRDLPEDVGQWEENHWRIAGEFIRRHHARLAHEIAIYGFPGLSFGVGEEGFPAMGREKGHPLMRLADLIGLTARSHGTSLRVCKD